MQRKTDSPGNLQDPLQPVNRKINHSRRIEVVTYLISSILQGSQPDFFRKIVNMGVKVPSLHNSVLA